MAQRNINELISKVILFDDRRAFQELIILHQNGIKNVLLKLLNFNTNDVEDLFQEVCTKIYRNISQFRGDSSFATWVYRITYTTFLNHKKKTVVRKFLGQQVSGISQITK